MKKWRLISVFTVLVTGMVLLSGCVRPDSGITTPAATPAKETVNETAPAPSAPTPAAAVPAIISTMVPTVVPTTVPPTKPTTVTTTVPSVKPTTDVSAGSLFIHVRAGGCGGDLNVFIAREGTGVLPPVYYYLPDRTIIEGPNEDFIKVKILMDGNSYQVKIPSGSYIAYLPDMKGGVPEQQPFVITPDGRTDIWFSGTLVTASARGCS